MKHLPIAFFVYFSLISFGQADCYNRGPNLDREIVERVGVGKDNKPIKVTAMTSMEYDFIGSKNQITTSLANHQLVMLMRLTMHQ